MTIGPDTIWQILELNVLSQSESQASSQSFLGQVDRTQGKLACVIIEVVHSKVQMPSP